MYHYDLSVTLTAICMPKVGLHIFQILTMAQNWKQQTDGQTTYDSNTALCKLQCVRRAVKKLTALHKLDTAIVSNGMFNKPCLSIINSGRRHSHSVIHLILHNICVIRHPNSHHPTLHSSAPGLKLICSTNRILLTVDFWCPPEYLFVLIRISHGYRCSFLWFFSLWFLIISFVHRLSRIIRRHLSSSTRRICNTKLHAEIAVGSKQLQYVYTEPEKTGVQIGYWRHV